MQNVTHSLNFFEHMVRFFENSLICETHDFNSPSIQHICSFLILLLYCESIMVFSIYLDCKVEFFTEKIHYECGSMRNDLSAKDVFGL